MSATLKFPQVLEIRVVNSTGQPVPRIGLMLTIFAVQKNNYHLATITDDAGKARVSLSEMRQSIRTDQELFPMDYASALEECFAEIEVKVCSSEEVEKAISAMEMFKSVGKSDTAIIDAFKNSSNVSYAPTLRRIKLDKSVNEFGVEIAINKSVFEGQAKGSNLKGKQRGQI
jgi:hypothetical protein